MRECQYVFDVELLGEFPTDFYRDLREDRVGYFGEKRIVEIFIAVKRLHHLESVLNNRVIREMDHESNESGDAWSAAIGCVGGREERKCRCMSENSGPFLVDIKPYDGAVGQREYNSPDCSFARRILFNLIEKKIIKRQGRAGDLYPQS